MAACFSLVSFYGNYLRRIYISAGLEPKTIQIDAETTMHCWAPKTGFPSTNGTAKPPLVLIQGFGPSAIWQWRHQVKSLSPYFSIYVPDLVFFGGSMTQSAERSEVFQAVSTAKLLEKLGVERFSVMGTSYGGFVSYRLATIYPERVDKVIIASSAINKKRKDNEELLKKAKVDNISDLLLPNSPSHFRALLGVSLYKQPSFLPNFLLNDAINTLYADNRQEKMELLVGLTLGIDDTLQICPLQQEALIIWGEYDNIFPLEKASELKKYLGERARLEVMKNTSHVPQIEDPDRFSDIVKKFLLGLNDSKM